MMSLLLALYSILAFIISIPLLVIGVGLLFGPALIVHAFRDTFAEAYYIERQKKDNTLRRAYFQPAYKMYVFGRGWYVTKYFSRHLLAHARRLADTLTRYTATVWYMACISRWYIKWFVLCAACLVITGLYIAARLQYVLVIAFTMLFFILHTLCISIWTIVVLVWLGVVSSTSFFYVKICNTIVRCPFCYKKMRTPTCLCPTCETEHTMLYPSIYGVLFHRCKTCERNLPTLDLLGRRQLARLCPHCHHRLPECIGAGATIHIALCGGPAVGKTSYIVMAMNELKNMYTKHDSRSDSRHDQYIVALTDSIQAQSLEASLRDMKSGKARQATDEITPRASIWKIQLPTMVRQKYIHIYDPAGKAFIAHENVSRQGYYQYTNGLIFVIDPFTLQSFDRKDYAGDRQISSTRGSSTLKTVQTYERMMNALEIFIHMSERRCYTLPLAVVVNKVDMPELEDEIGASAARICMSRDPSIGSESDAIHKLVRDFLCSHGLDNVVRDMESHFIHVRYFSCSAAARTPSAADGYVPIRVLDPLLWLFTHTGVLSE